MCVCVCVCACVHMCLQLVLCASDGEVESEVAVSLERMKYEGKLVGERTRRQLT